LAFPIATRALASWTAPSRRGFAQGITHAFARFGNARTPPLIALLIIAMSWRAAFIITGLVSFIWVVIWFWYFRDNPRDHDGVTAQDFKELPTQQHSEQMRMPLRLIVRKLPVTATDFCYGWVLWLYLSCLPLFFLHDYQLNLKDSALFSFGVFFAGGIGDTFSEVPRGGRNQGTARRHRHGIFGLLPLLAADPVYPLAGYYCGLPKLGSGRSGRYRWTPRRNTPGPPAAR
jgi:hypothetical protein